MSSDPTNQNQCDCFHVGEVIYSFQGVRDTKADLCAGSAVLLQIPMQRANVAEDNV